MSNQTQNPILTPLTTNKPSKKLTKLQIFITLLLLLAGSTCQNTVLQFWGNSFPKGVGGPYFILVWASFLFTLFFGIIYGIIRIYRKSVVPTKMFLKNYLCQGLSNALFGILLVYSSPIYRTPPIVFVVLINFGIVFGMIFTKLLVKQKKNIDYKNKSVIVSLLFLAIAVGITIWGDAYSKSGSQNQIDGWSIFWMIITTISSGFSALYNVLQQRYLKQTNKYVNNQQQKNINIIKTCYWTSLFQFVFMAIMFWIDIIPVFGFSNSVNSFATNFKAEIGCFFTYYGCGYKNLMFGIMFACGYILTLGSTMILNKQSANFSIYAIALQTPLSMLVFVVSGLGTKNIPLWSIIPSLVFIGIGIFIWKRWQIKQNQKSQIQDEQEIGKASFMTS